MTIPAIASMYLLGNLGVEGDEDSMVVIVGSMGLVSILVAGLVTMTMLDRTRNNELQQNKTVELQTKQRSGREFSARMTDVEEGMFAAALI